MLSEIGTIFLLFCGFSLAGMGIFIFIKAIIALIEHMG